MHSSCCKYGSEALIKASSHGHTKVARRLLQAGSHQDSADYVSSRSYDATVFLVLHSQFSETWLMHGITALIKAEGPLPHLWQLYLTALCLSDTWN